MDDDEIRAIVAQVGDAIAQVLDPDTTHSALNLDKIKTTGKTATFRVRLGAKPAFLKLFKDERAFARERRALEIMHSLPVPKLLFVAQKQHIIVTAFIHGSPLAQVVNADNIAQMAEHLGQWFGQLSNVTSDAFEYETPNWFSREQDDDPAPETWAQYLNNYAFGFDHDILATQSPILEGTEIHRHVFCHNDNALGNFIVTSDRRLYAVDFEDCRIKPEGWDLVTAARALLGRIPDQLDLISGSLLRGYQLTAKDCRLPENFDQVIGALALANAVGRVAKPV